MMKEIRDQNLIEAHRLGYSINDALPLLEISGKEQALEDVIARLASLHAIIASSYGFPKEKANNWLIIEGYFSSLSERERKYIESESVPNQDSLFQWQVEALWVLAWALGIHDNLDFSDSCQDDFVKMLPDLEVKSHISSFLGDMKLRPSWDLIRYADLAYCLHWAVRDCELNGRPPPGDIPTRVVVERRRALEWLIGEGEWDEDLFDT